MTTTATTTGVTDRLNVPINVGDTVMVTAWGGHVRLTDVRESFRVTGITARRNLMHDTDVANGRAIGPGYVIVLRRDGAPGFEGNRDR